MANERTVLAYVKTGLGLLLTGVGLLEIYDHPLLELAGWAAMGIAAFVTFVGIVRFRATRQTFGGRGDLQDFVERVKRSGPHTND